MNDNPIIHTHNIYYCGRSDEDVMEILNGQPEEFDMIREMISDYIDVINIVYHTKETDYLLELVHSNTSNEVDEFTISR